MTTPHPDFEALSAHHDGEAPDVAAHVAGCAACRTTLRWLRTTTALVSTPVASAPAAVQEEALARTLEAFGNTGSVRGTTEDDAAARLGSASTPVSTPVSRTPPQPRPVPIRTDRDRAAPVTPITSARRRRRPGGSGSGVWVGVGSAAAVLVAVVLGVGVLTGGGGGGGVDDTTVAAGAPQGRQQSSPTQEAADSPLNATDSAVGGGAGAGGQDGGDVGDIADGATLVARARPVLLQKAAPDTATTRSAPVAGLAPAAEPGLSSTFVGTRPCEMQVRTERPELGTVVYFATGRVQGVPVVVLGFAAAPAPAPVTLLALAQQEGCRVVLEAVGP